MKAYEPIPSPAALTVRLPYKFEGERFEVNQEVLRRSPPLLREDRLSGNILQQEFLRRDAELQQWIQSLDQRERLKEAQ